jgi:hypothetical protein
MLTLPSNCYVYTCYSNNTVCESQTKIVESTQSGALFSFYTPEALCRSCWGNSSCNNTLQVCTKTLVNLSSSVVSLTSNNTLNTIQITESIGTIIFPTPVPGNLFKPCNPNSNSNNCPNKTKRFEDQISTVVSYSDKVIYVTTSDLSHTSVQWTLNENHDVFFCSTDCQYEIQKAFLIKDGILNVKVFINDILDTQRSFQIKATDTCQIQECSFICFSYITNFICYSKSTQIILGTAFTASLLCLVIILSFMIYKVYCCYANRYFIHIKGDNNIPMQTLSMVCLCLLLIVAPVSSQCMSTTVVSSSITSCTNSFGNSSCKINLNSFISLPHLGNKACLLMQSPDGIELGQMNITYSLSLIVLKTTFSHYTMKWQGGACSRRDCRATGTCNPDSGCSIDVNYLNTALSGPCLQYPGVTTCQASCGCAGCGCFYCSDACLVSRYYFQPLYNTGLISVYTIDSSIVVPRVDVSLKLADKNLTTFTLDLTSDYSINNITYTLLGSLSSSIPYFQNRGFLLRGSDAFIAPVSTYGNPQFGTVNDIQSSSPGFSPVMTSFIFPSTSVQGIAAQYTVDYQFPSPGANLLNVNTQLPFTTNGISWSSNGTYPVGLNPNPGAVQLFVQTTDLLVRYLNTNVCPKIDTIVVNGCFNCPQGLTFTLSAFSVCDTGSAMVSLETTNQIVLETTFVSLSKNLATLIIYAKSSSRQIQGNLCLTYKTSKDCKPFITVLNDAPPLTQQEIENVYGNFTFNENGIGSLTEWWDSLTGSAALIKYAVIIGAVIGLLALVGFLGYMGYKYYTDYHENVMNKFVYDHIKSQNDSDIGLDEDGIQDYVPKKSLRSKFSSLFMLISLISLVQPVGAKTIGEEIYDKGGYLITALYFILTMILGYFIIYKINEGKLIMKKYHFQRWIQKTIGFRPSTHYHTGKRYKETHFVEMNWVRLANANTVPDVFRNVFVHLVIEKRSQFVTYEELENLPPFHMKNKSVLAFQYDDVDDDPQPILPYSKLNNDDHTIFNCYRRIIKSQLFMDPNNFQLKDVVVSFNNETSHFFVVLKPTKDLILGKFPEPFAKTKNSDYMYDLKWMDFSSESNDQSDDLGNENAYPEKGENMLYSNLCKFRQVSVLQQENRNSELSQLVWQAFNISTNANHYDPSLKQYGNKPTPDSYNMKLLAKDRDLNTTPTAIVSWVMTNMKMCDPVYLGDWSLGAGRSINTNDNLITKRSVDFNKNWISHPMRSFKKFNYLNVPVTGMNKGSDNLFTNQSILNDPLVLPRNYNILQNIITQLGPAVQNQGNNRANVGG